jgi:cell division protein ZapA
MAQVNVTIAGRPYRMACNDGEEAHLEELARVIDAKIAEMRRAFGEIGDQRLTVMAAITIADEMSEARRKIEALQAEVASVNETREAALHATDGWATALAEALDAASARIEGLTQQMNAGWRKP